MSDQLRLVSAENFATASNRYEAPWDLRFLSLETTGSTLGIYDTYAFRVDEYPLVVSTNYDDVVFYLNDEEIDAIPQGTDEYWLGDYPPGYYDVTASLELEHGDVERTDMLELFYEDDVFMLPFHLDYLYIQTNVEEAELFYQGEAAAEIGLDEVEFGPVLLEGGEELYVEASSPFGDLRSMDFFADDSNHHYIDLALSSNDAKSILESVEAEISAHYNRNAGSGSLMLEEVTLYPESNLLFQHGSWYIAAEADESWVSAYEDYDGDIVIEEETDRVYYVFEYINDNWILDQVDYYYGGGDFFTEEVSFTLNSSEEAVKELEAEQEQRELEALDDEIYDLMNWFTIESVYAVNTGYFYDLEDYIHPDGSDYQDEAFTYMESLYDRNIMQSIDRIEIKNYDVSGDTITVYTEEEYTIDYDFEELKVKTFDSVYEVKRDQDELKVVKLVETTETASQDIDY
ncbi:hypothetical protein ACFO4L_09745 [Bacillus daqingensis]|uniref:Uncharacterized protein n=1 Tax=Bacillus daqingensis TaxID=872396 RepID=A0ABV9NVD7_9BACI